MNQQDIQHFARLGALDAARRAIAAFPDILNELRAPTNGHARRQPRTPPVITGRAVLVPAKKRRTISAAGRRAIGRATKARWAALRAKGNTGRLETAKR